MLQNDYFKLKNIHFDNLLNIGNFIGKSNSPNSPSDPNANAIYDELKIYQGAMSLSDVLNDYQPNVCNFTLSPTTTTLSIKVFCQLY